MQGRKNLGLNVFKRFLVFLGFWYEDRTQKYDPKAHEKHPIHAKQRKNWKNGHEIDESHKSQLKFNYDVHLLNYTIKTLKI